MILMLFHLFCMFDDYWRIDHRSLETAGKSTVKIHYLRRSEYKTKTVENIVLPDHGGSHEERPRWGPGGPHPLLARPALDPREHGVWPPWPTSCRAPSRTSSPRKPNDKGWPDLLSEPMVELMDDVDNSRMLSNSPAVPPVANARALQPNGYSQHLTLVQRSRRPRSGFAICQFPVERQITLKLG